MVAVQAGVAGDVVEGAVYDEGGGDGFRREFVAVDAGAVLRFEGGEDAFFIEHEHGVSGEDGAIKRGRDVAGGIALVGHGEGLRPANRAVFFQHGGDDVGVG